MATRSHVVPVKFFAAVLWSQQDALDQAVARMAETRGPIDYSGPDHLFDVTDYYSDEMGAELKRRLIAFEQLASPEELSAAKLDCNRIEDELAIGTKRTVNLDIGYLDHNKLVLASMKAAGQKIYLTEGVYADLIARFKQGRYVPFEWTFPDFKGGRYDAELATLRTRYLAQLRQSQPAG